MSRRLLGLLVAAALLAACAPAAAFAVGDDAPPGIALAGSNGAPAGTLLNPATDSDDWYNIVLAEGDQLSVSLDGASGTDFAVALFWDGIGEIPEIDDLFRLWFWSGGYPRATSYVVPPGRAGTYYIQVHATDGQGASGLYTLTWAKTPAPAPARLYGGDRYQTAAAVSRSTFAEATSVVLASGENFPDALAASGLAGVLDAPVLLTRKAALPRDVANEMQRLRATDVYIIGSEDAVSADVETALTDIGYDVDRLGGTNRYQTARLVADRVALLGGSRDAFLVTGTRYADALAVAPAAFARRMPVLLTKPGELAADTAAALDSLDATYVVVAGSTASVSSAVASAAADACADNAGGGPSAVERWEGSDRFATAVQVAEHASALGWTGWGHVALATGKNFPDALGGGAAMGKLGGTLLLTAPASLTPTTSAGIGARKADIHRIYLLGSTSALSEQVRADAAAALLP